MRAVNPFHPFTPYDSKLLGKPSGRETDVSIALSLLKGSRRLCIVSGELGIGKSTFLRYSLSKALKKDDRAQIVKLTATPFDTINSIKDNLLSHLDYKYDHEEESKQTIGSISESDDIVISQALAVVKEAPRYYPPSIFELYNLIRRYESNTSKYVILMYDQLEHLLMTTDLDNKLSVLQSLINLSALPHVTSKVILAVRDKFLHEIFRLSASYPWITSHILYLHGLKEEEAREYIRTATKCANIEFSGELIDEIIKKLLDFDNYISSLALNAVCYSLASLAIENNGRAQIKHFTKIGELPGVIGKAISDSLHPLPNELISDLIYMLRIISKMSQYYGNPSLDEVVAACSGLPKDYVVQGISVLEARALVQRDTKNRYRLAHDSMHAGLRYLDKVSGPEDLYDMMVTYTQRWAEKDCLLESYELEKVRGLIIENATPLHYLALIVMSCFAAGIQSQSLELEEIHNSLKKRDSNVLLSIIRQHIRHHNRLSSLKPEEHFLLFMIDTEASIRFSLEGLLLDSTTSIPSWRFQSILELSRPRNLHHVISETQLFLRLPLHIQDAIIKYYSNVDDYTPPPDFLIALWESADHIIKPSLVPLLSKSKNESILQILRTVILKRDRLTCLSSLGIVKRLFSEADAIKILLDFAESGSTLLVRQSIYALSYYDNEAIWNKIAILSRNHPSALVREACIEVLGEKRLREYVDSLIDALKDEADFVRESACYALAKTLEPDEFAPLLLPLLGDDSPLVRDSVIHTVPPEFYDEDTIYARLQLLRRASESTKLLLLKTLTDSKQQDVDAMLDNLIDSAESDDVIINCIRIIGERRTKEAIPRLITLLKSDNEEIVCESLIALEKIGDPQTIRYVTNLVTHHSADVRERVVYLLGKFDGYETIKSLIALLFDVNDNIKVRTVYALGRLQAREAYNYVNLLSDSPEGLKRAKEYYFSRVK